MRGTVAKRLRREAYGTDGSPRFREYTEVRTKIRKKIVKANKRTVLKNFNGITFNGMPFMRTTLFKGGRIIHADKQRRFYQFIKKLYKLGQFEEFKKMAIRQVQLQRMKELMKNPEKLKGAMQ